MLLIESSHSFNRFLTYDLQIDLIWGMIGSIWADVGRLWSHLGPPKRFIRPSWTQDGAQDTPKRPKRQLDAPKTPPRRQTGPLSPILGRSWGPC